MFKRTQESHSTPRSHWEDIWGEDDFKRHDQEFQKILIRFREIMLRTQSVLKARMTWMQEQGAGTIVREELHVNPEKYSMYDAMFSKFSEWLHFKEVREGIHTASYEELIKSNPDLVNRTKI